MQEIEQAWGVQFAEGYNERLRFMAHLWQGLRCHYRCGAGTGLLTVQHGLRAHAYMWHTFPKALLWARQWLKALRSRHCHAICAFIDRLRGQELTIAAACCVCLRIRRPMTFYLGIEMLFAIKHVMLLGTGFSSYSHRGYTFYTYGMQLGERQRVHPFSTAAAPDAQVPILFLHGVGIGLLPYAPFVFRLAAAGQPLLAIESSHLGMRWVSHCPSEDEVAEAIDEILDQCKITTAAVVSGNCKPSFWPTPLMGARLSQKLVSLLPCGCAGGSQLRHLPGIASAAALPSAHPVAGAH